MTSNQPRIPAHLHHSPADTLPVAPDMPEKQARATDALPLAAEQTPDGWYLQDATDPDQTYGPYTAADLAEWREELAAAQATAKLTALSLI